MKPIVFSANSTPTLLLFGVNRGRRYSKDLMASLDKVLVELMPMFGAKKKTHMS